MHVAAVLDTIRLVEYIWNPAIVFPRDGRPKLASSAWTLVRNIHQDTAGEVAAPMRPVPTEAGRRRDSRKHVDACADDPLKYAPYLHCDHYLPTSYPIATGMIEEGVPATSSATGCK